MSDVLCAQCGEPWEYAYVQDEMRKLDKTRFLRGAGCEACDFGQACTACHGSGRQPHDWRIVIQEKACQACLGSRYLIIRQLVQTDEPARWEYGYQPRIGTVEKPDILFHFRNEHTLDGPVRTAKAHCLACRESAPPCPICEGTGKLTPVPDGDLEAARSELAASDEEPLGILARRALT